MPTESQLCSDLGVSRSSVREAVRTLVAAGVVTPDASLDAHMRAQYGLPVADPQDRDPAPDGGRQTAPDDTQDSPPPGARTRWWRTLLPRLRGPR